MNQLQNQVSPYLLQHKDNPVDWHPWDERALNRAIEEDKPIILSIGYAACHWCHVMEHESFEDQQVADLMNANFICIKVDREERPDIDHIYMDAIHAMGLQGGWPLNVFLMPDQKPFYGGTYFPKSNWVQLLNSIQQAYLNHKLELQQSADGFTDNMNVSKLGLYPLDLNTMDSIIPQIIDRISSGLDSVFGGTQKAPKFPIPSLGLLFEKIPLALLHQSSLDKLANLQLSKMAMGGIFDQVGGGFSRYSVDSEWFCPHFEKMLYDNAQLIRVYALAFKRTNHFLYREVVYQTIDFSKMELLASNGLYFASIDADSEGEEGKYYVWSFDELNHVLPQDKHQAFYQAYSIHPSGNWEHGKNILFKKHEVLNSQYKSEFAVLIAQRNKRIRPGTDNKQILAWNAYLAMALLEAGQIFDDQPMLESGKKLVDFMILAFVPSKNEFVLHQASYAGKPIIAFLDDLAALGLAIVHAYLVDSVDHLLAWADFIAAQIEQQHHQQNGLYNFHSNANDTLIAPKFEVIDSVCPSANSLVCEFYMWMGVLKSDVKYTLKGREMIAAVLEQAQANPIYFANWLRIYSEWFENPQAIIKYNANLLNWEDLKSLGYTCISSRELPTAAMVCIGDHCLAPVQSLEELKNQLATI